MSVRAGIVVTGTEVLSGIVTDRNGPWLSERLREHGVDAAHIMVVGDRPADLRAALDFLAREGMDLVVTSGGLGPTADDLTAEVVGEFAGRAMVLDEALEERIMAILRRNSVRWRNYSEEALRAGNRKQAVIPDGATILEPVGTAPGLVVSPESGEGPTVLVLPGPPRELQPMWQDAQGKDTLRAVLDRAGELEQRMLRLFGVPESEIALTLRSLEEDGVRWTGSRSRPACGAARSRSRPCSRPRPRRTTTRSRRGSARATATRCSPRTAARSTSRSRPLLERGRTIAVAESCTGGLMAGRLTDRAGSSAYVLGGVVVYSNAAKIAFADVPAELIERHGAVSPEVAAALADGARPRFGASLGIGITGVAGPGGGTEAKPVGMVCVSVADARGEREDRTVQLPGDRAMVRERTTTVAMHLLRRLLLRT